MATSNIDVKMLSKMFLAGANALEAQKEYINELNVFPVPDGDTGTNMSLTIMSAAKEISELPEDSTIEQFSKALSSGSLRGARGNSGVILSQLIRGFTKVIKTETEINVTVLTNATQKAVETAYKAVMKPKEGTILTVAKGAADMADELVSKTDDIEVFMGKIIEHCEYVLSQTPEMLPVLKEAGVVDSGGQGLLEILKGAYNALLGKEISLIVEKADKSNETKKELKYAYDTSFVILVRNVFNAKNEQDYRIFLESIGDNATVKVNDRVVNVSVITNDPGLVLTKAMSYGAIDDIVIKNLKSERINNDIISEEAKPVENTADSPTNKSETNNSVKEEIPADSKPERTDKPVFNEPPKEMGFIAVSVGEGMDNIFKGLGVDYIISGGQTMNPSTDDMVVAIDNVNAKNIFILPNNKNIILAANQAQYLVEDKNVIVIPTKTAPQGITALINFMPDTSVEDNEAIMNEEIKRVKTGQVTYAVRDTVINGLEIKQGNIMGIGDKEILSVGTIVEDTAFEMLERMIDDESELISIYYGADVDEECALDFIKDVENKYPDLDVEAHFGGQPIYYYICSVE